MRVRVGAFARGRAERDQTIGGHGHAPDAGAFLHMTGDPIAPGRCGNEGGLTHELRLVWRSDRLKGLIVP